MLLSSGYILVRDLITWLQNRWIHLLHGYPYEVRRQVNQNNFFLLFQWIREMVTFALGNKIENGVFLFFFQECRTKKKFSGPLRAVYVHDAFDQANPSRLQNACDAFDSFGFVFLFSALMRRRKTLSQSLRFLSNQEPIKTGHFLQHAGGMEGTGTAKMKSGDATKELATQGVLFPRFPLLLAGNQSEKGRCFLTNQDKLNPYNESFRALLTNCAFLQRTSLYAPHFVI